MRRSPIPSFVFLGCLFFSVSVLGAGSGDGASTAGPPVWGGDAVYARAVAEVKAGRFAAAIPLLADVVGHNPKNADAFNYLGYSHRKLGKHEYAMIYYTEALRLDPKHLGALEYQGELFIELGNLAGAEANLDQLARLCGKCEQHDDLAQAVAAYKAKPKA